MWTSGSLGTKDIILQPSDLNKGNPATDPTY
jgi:hypothetical protein